jgi:hypothetical protein
MMAVPRVGLGLRGALVLVLAAWALLAGVNTSSAMDIRCIEDSKYKYLFQIFGGDPRKFAAYLKIDTAGRALPDPELCRAALIYGGVGEPNDSEKILDFVIRNKGWLAAVYLSSPGGDVDEGQRLGVLIRTFGLKTVTALNGSDRLLYDPDFGLPPLPAEYSRPAAAAPKPRPPRCSLNEHVPVAGKANGFVSGLVRPETFNPTFDVNLNREGPAYNEFAPSGPDPKLCQKACADNAKCQAWTYQKPEARTDHRPSCELKEQVLGLKNDPAFVSGLTRPGAVDATFGEPNWMGEPNLKELDLARADPRLCQKTCLDESRCLAWSYRKPEGRTNGRPHCWLESAQVGFSPNDDYTVSGTVVRREYSSPTLEEKSDRPGSDYREFTLPRDDPKLCQSACVGDGRCRSWAFRKAEGRTDNRPYCWLKDQVIARVDDDLQFSGMVFRPGPFPPTYEKDYDRLGQDFRTFDLPVPDPRQCQKACTDDAKCRAWTASPPDPEFLISLMSGWDAYRNSQRALVTPPAPDSDWCTSSCGNLYAGGVDRSGFIHVHRPNEGFGSISGDNIGLLEADAAIRTFFTEMDVGDEVTRVAQSTSATTTAPIRPLRFPSHYADFLIDGCQGSDPERMQNLEAQLILAINELNPAASDVTLKIDRLRAALVKLHAQRRSVEQCVAEILEQNRLSAFDKLCGKGCDQKKVLAQIDTTWKKIISGNK